MIARFESHFSILPTAQKHLWQMLKPTSNLNFVLYNNSTITRRLNHRQSVDFDFFTDKPLDKKALAAAISFIGRSQLLQNQPETLTVNVPDNELNQYVKISFFGAIDFGRYAAPEITSDGVLQVAALEDLLATKTKVLLQRVESKDYQDVAAILKAGVPLERCLGIAQCMYGNNFQPSESLKAMTYFKGGDLEVLTADEKEILVRAASAVRRIPVVRRTADALSAL